MLRAQHYWDAVVRAGASRSSDPWPASQAIFAAHCSGRAVYICGNGGSAAIASHFACDLAWGRCGLGRSRVRAISLNDQLSLLSALENDVPHAEALAWMVGCYGRDGDLLIAISSSGNSPNILNAVRAAHARGMMTVGLCGFDGGQLKGLAKETIWVEADDYGVVQDVHAVLCHTIARRVGEAIEAAEIAATG